MPPQSDVATTAKVKCPWCGKALGRGRAFDAHRKRAHFWGEFECGGGGCGFKADFARDLADHMTGEDGHAAGNAAAGCPACKDQE